MRATSRITASLIGTGFFGRRMFIGQALRSALKPACISLRHGARHGAGRNRLGPEVLLGEELRQIFHDGERLPHHLPPMIAAPARGPRAECSAMSFAVSGVSSGITVSRNGMPAMLSAIHGRSDQEE